jgi:hypothetical protein
MFDGLIDVGFYLRQHKEAIGKQKYRMKSEDAQKTNTSQVRAL